MSNSRKALGTALEHQVADRAAEAGFGARLQPLSGILKAFPNDVMIETADFNILGEAKVRSAQITGGAKFINLNLDWLKGVVENAQRIGCRLGVVMFRAKRSRDIYVLLRYEDFLQILKNSGS